MRHTAICLAVLLIMFAASVSSAQTPEKKKLPDAKSLIEKHLEAAGGKKKMLAMRSMHFKSKITTIAGRPIHGWMEIHFARIRVKDPKTDKLKDVPSFRFHMEQGGAVTTIASNGTISWQTRTEADGTGGTVLLSKAEVAMFLNMFDPSGFARYEKTFKTWETLRKALIDGRMAYEVKMISKEGVKEHYYFDAKSGLMTSMKSFIPTPQGEQVSKTTFSDYRDVSGIMTAFKTIGEGVGFKQVTEQMPDGGYDVKIDPKIFKPSAEVITLSKKKKPASDAKKKDQ